MDIYSTPPLPERPEVGVRGRRFESPAARARSTTVAFCAFIAAAAFTIVADLYGLAAVGAGLDETSDADSMLSTSDTLDRISGISMIATWLLVVVLFLRWWHRVNRNLPPLGIRDPRTSPGWAVGSFLIPFVNWVVPKIAANDVWRSGDPELGRGDRPWHELPVGAIVHVWWAAYLVTSIFDNVVGRAWWNASSSLEEYRTVYVIDLIAAVGNIVAALLAIAVVRRMTRRQEARAASLGAA